MSKAQNRGSAGSKKSMALRAKAVDCSRCGAKATARHAKGDMFIEVEHRDHCPMLHTSKLDPLIAAQRMRKKRRGDHTARMRRRDGED